MRKEKSIHLYSIIFIDFSLSLHHARPTLIPNNSFSNYYENICFCKYIRIYFIESQYFFIYTEEEKKLKKVWDSSLRFPQCVNVFVIIYSYFIENQYFFILKKEKEKKFGIPRFAFHNV